MDKYYYNGRHKGEDLKWLIKLALLLSIFVFVVLKNSGCASKLANNDAATSQKADRVEEPIMEPLTFYPASIELVETGNSTAVIRVTGGKGPYSFFLKGGRGLSLSVLDSKSAMLVLDDAVEVSQAKRSLLYVLDDIGNLASAPVSVTTASALKK